MSTRNAAALGRWCFAAGWLLMAALSVAWRRLDWPDWCGAAAVLLVVLGGFRLIDRAAARIASRA